MLLERTYQQLAGTISATGRQHRQIIILLGTQHSSSCRACSLCLLTFCQCKDTRTLELVKRQCYNVVSVIMAGLCSSQGKLELKNRGFSTVYRCGPGRFSLAERGETISLIRIIIGEM